jgi:hypothetical protein
MKKLKPSTLLFLVVRCLQSATAAWCGWSRGQEPRLPADQACKKQCKPMRGQIKAE